MSRPVNWERRAKESFKQYNALYGRYIKLKKQYMELKHKKAPAPLTPTWRRLMGKWLQ